MDPLTEKRLNANLDCINLLVDFILGNPYLRLEQVLEILDNDANDYFNEEPQDTFKRWYKIIHNNGTK